MTTAALAKTQPAALAAPLSFTDEQAQMIRNQFAYGASDDEFAMLMGIAKARNLNPLLKQIFFVKRYDSKKKCDVWATQVSIDGMRVVASRTGGYDGQDEPENEYETATNGERLLTCVKVKVYRKGIARPFVGISRWSEYVQTTREGEPTKFWKTMPHTMLAKCAEALALRKAFPEDTGGLYIPEEMMQAENVTPYSRQLPSVNPHDDGHPLNPDEDVYRDIIARIESAEEMLAGLDSYDKWCALRLYIGEPGKPSALTELIQKSYHEGTLLPDQRKEVNRRYKHIDYILKRDETKGTWKPDAAASFVDPPDEVDPAEDFDRGA